MHTDTTLVTCPQKRDSSELKFRWIWLVDVVSNYWIDCNTGHREPVGAMHHLVHGSASAINQSLSFDLGCLAARTQRQTTKFKKRELVTHSFRALRGNRSTSSQVSALGADFLHFGVLDTRSLWKMQEVGA
jgi:hypothetical protein